MRGRGFYRAAVPRYLSPEWIAALDDAARERSSELGRDLAGVTLVVEQRVVGVPGGDVVYVVTVDNGDVRVTAGPHAGHADVVLTADYPIARALARGETNAQRAFASGGLKVGGRVDRLTAAARALAALEHGFDAVRETTTYD